MLFLNDEKSLISRISFHKDFYDEIKKFYYYVLGECVKNKYDFIILTTRRSYVLYKIFEKNYSKSTSYKTIVINNHSLGFFTSEFWTGKSVLIVDDILINGRAIRTIYEETKKASNNRILVFAQNEGALCITEEIENHFISNLDCNIGIVSESVWRNYSSFLNELVLISGMGYISYVNSYISSAYDSDIYISKFTDCYKSYEISNGIFSSKKICGSVYYLEERDIIDSSENIKNNFKNTYKYLYNLSLLNIKPCIRKYTFLCADKKHNVYIPYVFLPETSEKQLVELSNIIFSFLPIKRLQLGIDALSTEKVNSADSLVNYVIDEKCKDRRVLYMLLTNLCSGFLMESLQRDIQLSKQGFNVEKNLNTDTNLLVKVEYSKCSELNELKGCDKKFSYFKSVTKRESECIDCLTDVLDDITEEELNQQNYFYAKVSEYLFKMRSIDHHYAEENRDRANGIRISDIVSVLQDKILNLNIEEHLNSILTVLINCWDSGRGSCVIKEFYKSDEGLSICSSLINGEHIFIYPFEKNYNIGYQFRSFSELAHTTVYRNLLNFAKFMDDRNGSNSHEYVDYLSFIFSGIEDDYKNAIDNYSILCYSKTDLHDVLDYIMNYYGQGVLV